jgi:hypothetical protein
MFTSIFLNTFLVAGIKINKARKSDITPGVINIILPRAISDPSTASSAGRVPDRRCH